MKIDKKYIFILACLFYLICVLVVPFINYLRFISADNNYPPLTKFVRFPTLLFFVAFFFIYWFYIKLRCRGFGGTGRGYWLLVCLGGLYLCAVGPIFSIDLYEFIFRGRIMSIYGANPYITPPSSFPNDIFYPIIFWKFQPTIYGPLWSWLVYLPTKFAQNSVFLNVFLVKAMLFLFYLLSGFQIYRLAKALEVKNPQVYSEMFLFNPYFIMMSLVDGHNDIVLLSLLLWSLVELVRGRDVSALALLALSALAKYISVILVPIYLAVILSRDRFLRKKLTDILKGAVISLSLLFIVFAPFWTGFKTFAALLDITASFHDNTVSHLIFRLISKIMPALEPSLFITLAKSVFFILLFLIAYWVLKKADDKKRLMAAIFYSFAAFLCLGSFQFGQWYLVWIAPFALFLNIRFNLLIYLLVTLAALISFWKRFPYLMIVFSFIYLSAVYTYNRYPKSRMLLERALTL